MGHDIELVHTSDWHGDRSTMGVDRFEDISTAAWKTERHTALLEGVNIGYVFTGDLTNPDEGPRTIRSIKLATEIAVELAVSGIQSWWLAGNHDVVEDGSGITTLSPLRGLEGINGLVRVVETARAEIFGGVNLIFLPFTASSHGYDVEIFLKEALLGGKKNVVVSHLAVEGIQPGEETTEMARGREVALPLGVLRAWEKKGEHVRVLQGHYHRQQRFYPFGPEAFPIDVAGALARLTIGESESTPGFLVHRV